eukprot:m.1120903 g.1120903  ORF g.1120903 m.1120903 type:complete len:120 (+) comp24397_c1_seq32:3451-3810(+)
MHPNAVDLGTTTGNTEGSVRMTPLDSFRRRVYVAMLGLDVTVDGGRIASVTMTTTSVLEVALVHSNSMVPKFTRLRLDQRARAPRSFSCVDVKTNTTLQVVRGACQAPSTVLLLTITWT